VDTTNLSGVGSSPSSESLTEEQFQQLEADVRRLWAETSTTMPTSMLSKRQMEVMHHVACGLSNQAIATKLVISSNTVGTHVQHLLKMFDADSRSRLMLIYVLRYLSPEERATWQKETPFEWPRSSQRVLRKLMWIILSQKYCDVSNAKLGELLGITEATVKTHIRNLLSTMPGGRNRQSLQLAAVLNLPE